jgi:hypothetical protein
MLVADRSVGHNFPMMHHGFDALDRPSACQRWSNMSQSVSASAAINFCQLGDIDDDIILWLSLCRLHSILNDMYSISCSYTHCTNKINKSYNIIVLQYLCSLKYTGQ